MNIPATSHLIDFLAVIDHGGLSAGARSLGRAQAAVTYSIQSLERELGVTLFNRAARPIVPTEEGFALASVARDVVHDLGRLKVKAASLREGVESSIGLTVDTLMPMAPLIPLVSAFARQFPAVDLEVAVDAMSSPLTAVLNGTCELAIAGPMALRHRELDVVPLLAVERVAVASPDHPLAGFNEPVSQLVARSHRQIIMLNRDQMSPGRVSNAVSDLSWRTTDIGAKREMLLAGLGWGNMPLHVVKDDLVSGRLVELRCDADLSARWAPLQLYLIRSTRHPSGKATDWLFRQAGSFFEDLPFQDSDWR